MIEIEGFKGSVVSNMDLVFQIYNLLHLVTYSIVIDKRLSHFSDQYILKQNRLLLKFSELIDYTKGAI